MQHCLDLAQHGKDGVMKLINDGTSLDVMGLMQKTGSTDMLEIGVRLFKKPDSNTWTLTTLLTIQPDKAIRKS